MSYSTFYWLMEEALLPAQIVTLFGIIYALKDYISEAVKVLGGVFIGGVPIHGSLSNSALEVCMKNLWQASFIPVFLCYRVAKYQNKSFFYRAPDGDHFQVFWYQNFPIILKQSHNESLTLYYFKYLTNPENFLVWLQRKVWDLEEMDRVSTGSKTVKPIYRLFEKHGRPFCTKENNIEYPPAVLEDALDQDYIREVHSVIQSEATRIQHDYYIMENIRELDAEITAWKDGKEWFLERRLPWKRGCILYGIPGTGKSTAVKILAESHQVPLVIMELATFKSNQSLTAGWAELTPKLPGFLLIEDIDSVFEGTLNCAAGSDITFDVFLNLLSGVNSIDGYFLFLTTNHLEKLDVALASLNSDGKVETRAGRVDRAIEFGHVDRKGKEFIAEKILGDRPALKERALQDDTPMSISAFQELCMRMAIHGYWKALN